MSQLTFLSAVIKIPLRVLVIEPSKNSLASICIHLLQLVRGIPSRALANKGRFPNLNDSSQKTDYRGTQSLQEGLELFRTAVKEDNSFTLVMMQISPQNSQAVLQAAQEIQRLAPDTHILLLTLAGRAHRVTANQARAIIRSQRCSELTKPIRRGKIVDRLTNIAGRRSIRPPLIGTDPGRQGPRDAKEEATLETLNSPAPVAAPTKGEKEKEKEEKESVKPSSRPRILVVEDNRINQKVILTQLSKLNCDTELAENGNKALEMVQQQRGFALVLMDLAMPVMDGYQCTEFIRALEDPYFKTLPIVALTASLTETERQRCVEVGMSDFLSKPLRLKDLQDTITKWCG
mgnify:CR=1 FL=1